MKRNTQFFRDADEVGEFLSILRSAPRESFPDGVLTMSQYVAIDSVNFGGKVHAAIGRAAERMGKKWVREGHIRPWKSSYVVDMGRYKPMLLAPMCGRGGESGDV